MHRDLKRETTKPPEANLLAQQRRFDQFRARFNQERPHEALKQRTPSEFYEVSSRRLMEPRCGKDFEYSERVEALRVNNHGSVATHRGAFLLSKTLASELVGIDWYVLNRAGVLFGPLPLGELVASVQHRRVRFFPVDVIDLNQPLASKGEDPSKPSPMSPDNVPLSISTVTHVPG